MEFLGPVRCRRRRGVGDDSGLCCGFCRVGVATRHGTAVVFRMGDGCGDGVGDGAVSAAWICRRRCLSGDGGGDAFGDDGVGRT